LNCNANIYILIKYLLVQNIDEICSVKYKIINKCTIRSKFYKSFLNHFRKKDDNVVIWIHESYNSKFYEHMFSPDDGSVKEETCCLAVPWVKWTPLTE
jgi:hypothetical protein